MDSSDTDPTGNNNPNDFQGSNKPYAMSGKIMLSAIVILFFVVILMVLLHVYARWYLLRARRLQLRRRNRRSTTVFFSADPSVITSGGGLNPTVLKSLPVFTFSDTTHKDPIECSVCLSEFEERETGRVLPNCKHTFHVDCIDMWFLSHSTCPLCRSLVELNNAGIIKTETATSDEQVVIVNVIPSEPVLAIEPGSSSGLSEDSPRSGRKLAAIEIPMRIEDDSTQSFRSPMSRMLSFTRMLSRDRRSALSPISGAQPVSPSSSCRTPMSEIDIERGGEIR